MTRHCRIIRLFAGVAVVLLCAGAVAQTHPDLSGSNVILRDTPGGGAEGNFELYTVKDDKVLHTEHIGDISYYGRSRDRLVTISIAGVNPDQTRVRVFELPSGKPINSFTIPGIFCGALQQGADEWALVDKDTVYFSAYQLPKGIFVKTDLLNGATTIQLGGAAGLKRAGDYIIAGSQFAFQAYSIPDFQLSRSIPKLERDRGTVRGMSVFVPHDGLYSWKIQGEFTRVADESLQPIPDPQRQAWTIVRGVFAVQSLDTAATDKMLVILSGPRLNGDLRGEAIESALTIAKPSEQKIVATIKLPFTPTERIFRTAQENVIAIVNAADGSIIKFDCAMQKEVGRIELPPVQGRLRPLGVQIVY